MKKILFLIPIVLVLCSFYASAFYDFGGIFDYNGRNTITGTRDCPQEYIKDSAILYYSIESGSPSSGSISYCYRQHTGDKFKYSFGGFLDYNGRNPITDTRGCPAGYTQATTTTSYFLGDLAVPHCYKPYVPGDTVFYDFGGIFDYNGRNTITGTRDCPQEYIKDSVILYYSIESGSPSSWGISYCYKPLSCSPQTLALCPESECSANGGFWINNMCNSECPTGYVEKEGSCVIDFVMGANLLSCKADGGVIYELYDCECTHSDHYSGHTGVDCTLQLSADGTYQVNCDGNMMWWPAQSTCAYTSVTGNISDILIGQTITLCSNVGAYITLTRNTEDKLTLLIYMISMYKTEIGHACCDFIYPSYKSVKCSINLANIEPDGGKALCNLAEGQWLMDADNALAEFEYNNLGFVNFCCGDDGVIDNGVTTQSTSKINDSMVCVKDETGWKWLYSNNNRFAIKEKNYPPEKDTKLWSNDIVSNVEKWEECNSNNLGYPALDYALLAQYKKDFARFYCYKSGNSYRYSVCSTSPDEGYTNIEAYNINTVPTALRDIGSVTTMIFETKPNTPFLISGAGGKMIDITQPAERNNDKLISIRDWRDYSSLEFFIKTDDITVPLYLRIYAPENNIDSIVFDEPVMDYVVNTPAKNKWMHVVIPIDATLVNIRSLEFYAKSDVPLAYTAFVDKIFLRPKDDISLAFCSDKIYSPPTTSNMWIKDLDENEAACRANKAYNWTGSKCCGDDPEEYYSDTDSGCWNSNIITDDDIAVNVEYDIIKTPENKFIQNYPDQEFTFKLDNIDYTRIVNALTPYPSNVLLSSSAERETHTVTPAVYISGPAAGSFAPVNLFFEISGLSNVVSNIANVVTKTEYSESTAVSQNSTTERIVHVCSSNSCTYPLPAGKQGTTTTVINIHPDKYNLYIVEKDGTRKQANPSNSTAADSGAYLLIENVKPSITFYNKSFYGCKAPDYILNTKTGLVDNSAGYCTVKGTHFCSYNNEWNNELGGTTDSSLRNTSKQIPLGTALTEGYEFGCCPADYCWNGTQCLGDMSKDPDAIVTINDTLYSCIQGDWKIAIKKFTWDHQLEGVCPSPTQCLVEKTGNPENNNNPSAYSGPGKENNPICIETRQFVEDHYCDNGNWTSRTKLITAQLLNISGETDSFTLYCDDFYKVLPSYGDTTIRDTLIQGKEMIPLISYACFNNQDEWNNNNNYDLPCTNNFCSLTYSIEGTPNIVLAASINKKLDFSLDIPPLIPFLQGVFGITNQNYCSYLFDESGISFSECNPDDDIEFWYSNGLNSVIQSYIQPLDGMEPPTTWDRIILFFQNIFNFFLGEPPVDSFGNIVDVSIINQTRDFNRLCISKQDNKKAYLIMDSSDPDKTFLAAEYENIGTDMCTVMNTLELNYNFLGSNIYHVCNHTETGYKIYAETADYATVWSSFDTLWDSLADTCTGLI